MLKKIQHLAVALEVVKVEAAVAVVVAVVKDAEVQRTVLRQVKLKMQTGTRVMVKRDPVPLKMSMVAVEGDPTTHYHQLNEDITIANNIALGITRNNSILVVYHLLMKHYN